MVAYLLNIKAKNFFCCFLGLVWGLLFPFTATHAFLLWNKNPIYERLEEKLPLYQAALKHPWPQLTEKKTLQIGMRCSEVLLLRERLCATRDLPKKACYKEKTNTLFDEQLKAGVMLFQSRHALVNNGNVDQATRQALNVSPEQRVHQIQINLQRWSRLIANAEPAYIWVNIPDHHLRLIKNHRAVLMERIVVGKPSRQTPELSSAVTRIILNPYWTVPPGIARSDVIPQIMKNKNYLQQHRMRVFSAGRLNRALDPAQVDWAAAKKNPGRIILRQEPGPHNALGQIKFEFINPHMVYLHDTPSKQLFAAKKRLFSSGCVRMEDPFNLLRALAELDSSIKQAISQIHTVLASGKTVVIPLNQPIPIHLTYITAWVDSAGILHFWDDVYLRDTKLSQEQEAKLEQDLTQAV